MEIITTDKQGRVVTRAWNPGQTFPRTSSDVQPHEITRMSDPKSFAEEFIWREYQTAVIAKKRAIESENEVRANIKKISTWMYDLSKKRPWLRLAGYIGNGKSTMLAAIESFYSKTYRKSIRHITATEVVKMAAEEEKTDFNELCKCPRLAIDDLGTEPNEIVVFGNKSQPMRDLLYARYDKRLYTIFTTNLIDADFAAYYGDRIADRCKEMQIKITFTQKSYRK